jgi:hypothetical protein
MFPDFFENFFREELKVVGQDNLKDFFAIGSCREHGSSIRISAWQRLATARSTDVF